MFDLLVIGSASLDVLHFAGQTAEAAGGAGMYTAVAAHRAGGQVVLFSPKPEPVPEPLQPVVERVAWIGPVVPPAEMPHFEIAHHGGGKATLVNASWGAEARLSPNDLPDDLSGYRFVHITALGTAQRQLDFLQACRKRGANYVSVGTYAKVVYGQTETVRALFEQADLFFMNENEANGLFGSVEAARTTAGKLLFVTLGEKGAWVIQGDHATHVRTPLAKELDPTGAGDTFCGATLAALARGRHPVMAARQATPLAAQMIEHIGARAHFRQDTVPSELFDPRVRIYSQQVAKVANLVKALPEVQPFDFTAPAFPPVGHPATLDFFFAATLQQFGFWHHQAGRYHEPMIAPIGGTSRKGSDYLWHAYMRCLPDEADFYSPLRQANLTRAEMLERLRADDGSNPMPALDLHLAQAQAYGRDMLALNMTTERLLTCANASPHPLRTFLQLLDHIGGWKEDPLRKKSGLLALILNQRPERFLSLGVEEQLSPVIDYHLMRSCLRIGLLDVLDESLRQALTARQLLSASDEWAIRRAAYTALEQIAAISGKSMGAIDWFFFNARKRCPEMTEPECILCAVDPICAHRKALFQPVRRTTYY